jgi:hypothetical protein
MQDTIDKMIAYARENKPEAIEPLFTLSDILYGLKVSEERKEEAKKWIADVEQSENILMLRDTTKL